MKKTLPLLIVWVLGLTGCVNMPATESAPFQDPNGNFQLRIYADQMHFDGVPLDIKVWIDGDLAVTRNFSSQRGTYDDRFRFNLPPGNHELKAKSVKANTEKSWSFEIKGTLFGALYFSPKQKDMPPEFSFRVSNEPIYVAPGQGGV